MNFLEHSETENALALIDNTYLTLYNIHRLSINKEVAPSNLSLWCTVQVLKISETFS